MKKVGIITIVDGYNYGNRLQNYATQEFLKKLNFTPTTLINKPRFNNKCNKMQRIKKILGQIYSEIFKDNENKFRKKRFKEFNKNINFSKKTITIYNQKIAKQFDYFIAGSDQIWKPSYERLSEMDLLTFARPEQRISLSASFGIEKISKEYSRINLVKKELLKFKAISVREDKGKEIVEELTGRTDAKVLIDPTMLLTADEWDKVSKKPKQLDKLQNKNYILNYFLGELSEKRKQEIQRIAKENNCEIINIMDKKDKYYVSGPSEFLWLEKNAFLVCTDSFHASVFAIIFDRPFVVFNRQEKENKNMGTRIDTLLSKFNISDRRYNNKEITKAKLKHDNTEAYKILESERKKSETFLKKALDIK